ncbi:hypothetical protein AMK32_35975 [Streptomyces sp. CB01883]|nr:hypothetical protein AMK32_35975 [Streptomyces sp. CB01883]
MRTVLEECGRCLRKGAGLPAVDQAQMPVAAVAGRLRARVSQSWIRSISYSNRAAIGSSRQDAGTVMQAWPQE